MRVRSVLVAGLLPSCNRLHHLSGWCWAWGLFPSLLTIQGGRLSCRLYRVCGLNWRVSCLGASVLPLVVPSVCSGCSSVVPSASCVGGWSVSCGRVVLVSAVLLPLVCASGVISGLHPSPFLLSVLVFGVQITCARFQIVTKEKTKKAKETGNNS